MKLLQQTALAARIRACRRCGLRRSCTAPVPGIGPPDAAVVFLGRNPGQEEDLAGEPFVGRSGKGPLAVLLQHSGLTRESVGIVNTLSCFTPDNRRPKDEELAACADWTARQLRFFKSKKLLVTLGREARDFALPGMWSTHMHFVEGRLFRFSGQGCLVLPLRHPSFFLRNQSAWTWFCEYRLSRVANYINMKAMGGESRGITRSCVRTSPTAT